VNDLPRDGFAPAPPAAQSTAGNRIVLYDTTLRDGAQTQGVDFSTADKWAIAAELDRLGIDYIEGGWPGTNPTDDAFFADPVPLHHARLTAFGMTRRHGRSAANDPGLNAVLQANTQSVCLVGKASDLAVECALGIAPADNLALIGETIQEAAGRGREVLFDAEHFFDGYKRNPHYALSCLRSARQAGASWLVLCDTNGGTLPEQISHIVGAVAAALPNVPIGIHAHNDTETAVAGTLAAVAAGARMVQGTMNGLGERCGNANLIALIPTLMLKLGYQTNVGDDGLRRLKAVSRMIDERLNRAPNRHAAYVGENAFAHKAGLHAASVARDSTTYEHVPPARVGNRRHVIVSNQSGRANLMIRLAEAGVDVPPDDARLPMLLDAVKQREFAGYTYDGAEASFELLARRTLGEVPEFFRVASLRVTHERRALSDSNATARLKAVLELEVQRRLTVASCTGDDAMQALEAALRKALVPAFPALAPMRIAEYRVRTLPVPKGSATLYRVVVDSNDADTPSLGNWSTVGVSTNIVDASLNALHDAITYRLFWLHLQAPGKNTASPGARPRASVREPRVVPAGVSVA
jgi:2-isopropylmalate synthase